MAYPVARASQMSLQYDEAVTLNYVARGPAYILSTYQDGSNNHLLHSLLVDASVSLFGWSELAIRLPALLGGLASVVGTVLLTRRLIARWRASVLSGVLLTAVPLTADYFVLARGYSLSLAAIVGLMLLVERAMREQRVGWVMGVLGGGLVAASIAAVPSAVLALGVLGAAAVGVWWRARLRLPSRGPLLAGLVVGAVITLAAYARILGSAATTLVSLAGTEAGESGSKVLLLLESLTGNPWTGAGWVILVSGWAAREAYWFLRSAAGTADPLLPFLAITFLLYLAVVPVGYARNHVFLVLLLVLLTVAAVERLAFRWRPAGEGFLLAAAAWLLIHVPLTFPVTDRSVIAYSAVRPTIALLAETGQPPCLAAEERFLLPLAYYAARGLVLIRRACPYVLLKWPYGTGSIVADRRMDPEDLDRFGVVLLDRRELDPRGREELDRASRGSAMRSAERWIRPAGVTRSRVRISGGRKRTMPEHGAEGFRPNQWAAGATREHPDEWLHGQGQPALGGSLGRRFCGRTLRMLRQLR